MSETPLSRVPEPGTGEIRTPITDAEAVVAFSGATARSARRLPLVVRIAIAVVGIAIVVGLPFVALLSN